jgi:hypothetical protein
MYDQIDLPRKFGVLRRHCDEAGRLPPALRAQPGLAAVHAQAQVTRGGEDTEGEIVVDRGDTGGCPAASHFRASIEIVWKKLLI